MGHQNGLLRCLLFHLQDKSALSITESSLPTLGVSHTCESWHPCLPVFQSWCHLLFIVPEDGGGSGPVPCVRPPLTLRATTPPLPRFSSCIQHSPGALETVDPQSQWPFPSIFSLNSDWNGDSVLNSVSFNLCQIKNGCFSIKWEHSFCPALGTVFCPPPGSNMWKARWGPRQKGLSSQNAVIATYPVIEKTWLNDVLL